MAALSTAQFDYELPADLVAQRPAERRDGSRLLVVDRARHAIEHRIFAELPVFLRRGDVLFRNAAAVLPARLSARRPTGGRIECFLLRPRPDRRAPGRETWQCLLRPGRRLAAGAVFATPDGTLTGEVLAWEADGTALVGFTLPGGESVAAAADRLGDIPLPPYIERSDSSGRERDRERYQTVYARRERPVAVAAPTAGLHFTPELLARLAADGVGTADLILHVGLGTFQPIAAETVEEHRIHRELYEISPESQRALFSTPPARRVAVGTTSVRSIEDFLADHSAPLDRAHVAEAGLFIYPPRSFRGVDALITNFHQPRSTLLCLVAAFLAPESTDGIAWIREIYAEAIARRYRFFSYGDAMLIL